MSESTANVALPSIAVIRDFFGMTGKEMMTEWRQMTDEDKLQIKQGISDGTLNY